MRARYYNPYSATQQRRVRQLMNDANTPPDVALCVVLGVVGAMLLTLVWVGL